MKILVLSAVATFTLVSAAAQATCPERIEAIRTLVEFSGPVGDCSRDLFHPNGTNAFYASSGNWYHVTGAQIYFANSRSIFYANGRQAFYPSSGNWYHDNDNQAYEANSENWYHRNGSQAYYPSSGNLYYENGEKVGNFPHVSELEMLRFLGIAK